MLVPMNAYHAVNPALVCTNAEYDPLLCKSDPFIYHARFSADTCDPKETGQDTSSV